MVTLDDIRAAHGRIVPFIHRTPVLRSRQLDRLLGATVHCKGEHLQKVGAFKARGALNAVLQLDARQASRGVATHSSGNHAQGLAYAAAIRGLPCWIVMPTTAPDVKRQAVRDYGATIVDCAPTLAAREARLAEVVADTGAHVVPPYNDVRIIAGQGTAALELLDDVPELDVVIAPVGGGGLLSGTAVVCRGVRPSIEVLGAEPAMADDAKRSMETGVLQPPPDAMTIADGLRTGMGPITFDHCHALGVTVHTCSEEAIREAMMFVMERLKAVVEPSACVPLAVMLEHPDLVAGRNVGVILTGGNVDIRRMTTF